MIPRHHSLQATKQQAACSARPPVHAHAQQQPREPDTDRWRESRRDGDERSIETRRQDDKVACVRAMRVAPNLSHRMQCNGEARSRSEREKREEVNAHGCTTRGHGHFQLHRSVACIVACFMVASLGIAGARARMQQLGRQASRLPVSRHAFMVFR